MTGTTRPVYATDFRGEQRRTVSAGPEWLDALRSRALERFETEGLPTTGHEEWRETNLAALARTAFAAAAADPSAWSRARVEALPIGAVAGPRLVLVNGRVRADLSDLRPDGPVVVRGLAEAIADGDDTVRAHLGRIAVADERALTALNTAFLADGAYVRVADGASPDEPVHVVHVFDGTSEHAMEHSRTLVVCGDRAQLRVVESYVAADGADGYFRNAVTEIVVGSGARVRHARVQLEADGAWHLGEVGVRQGRDSDVASTHFALGARLARIDAGARLDGEGAHHALNGLYVADGEGHVDHHTTLDHAVPHCTSHELFKGILGGRSKAVFKGRIVVRPDAQKTDAIQRNPNLLLSDDATIHSRPQLEIYADDVKCTHGATVGQIDAEQLFYLRSRGIDPVTGRDLLIHAFAREVLDHVGIDEIREVLEREIDARLPDA